MATIRKIARDSGTVYQAHIIANARDALTDAETTTKGGARSLPIVPEALSLLHVRREAQQGGKVAALRPSGLVSRPRSRHRSPSACARHRTELVDNWTRAHQRKPLRPIEPLD